MSSFYTIICMGPIGLYVLTNIVQVRTNQFEEKTLAAKIQAASFHEVMSLGHATTGVEGMKTW